MEKGKGVDKLKKHIALLVVKRDVAAYKAAPLELFYRGGEFLVVVEFGVFEYRFARKSLGFCRQSRNNGYMVAGFFEQRPVEVVELPFQLAVGREEQPVDVLRYTLLGGH